MRVKNLSEESLHLCLEGNTVIEVKQNEIVDMPAWVYKMLRTTARLKPVEEEKTEKVVEVKEEPKKEVKVSKKKNKR